MNLSSILLWFCCLMSLWTAHVSAQPTRTQTEVLANGAILYRQYCSGCHSVSRQTYRAIADRVGWGDEEAKRRLFLTPDTNLNLANLSSLPAELGKQTFGIAPPDLSLYVSQHGEKHLYDFLNTFYLDPNSRTGVNNRIVPNTAMPAVLMPLKNSGDKGEYQRVVSDLVRYLSFSSDPTKEERESLGIWVLSFLTLFLILTWLLKKEYWRDVH